MNDATLDKAFNILLNRTKSVSNPSKFSQEHIAIPARGGYKISDIRIMSISSSYEYGTWSVEIALKKDDESGSSLKRFKMVISENAVPKWQKVQIAHMKRTLDIDIEDDFDFEDAEPVVEVTGSVEVVNEIDVDIITDVPESIGSENECIECDMPNGEHSPFCKVGKESHT